MEICGHRKLLLPEAFFNEQFKSGGNNNKINKYLASLPKPTFKIL